MTSLSHGGRGGPAASKFKRRLILAFFAVVFQWSRSVWGQETIETIVEEPKSKKASATFD